MAGSAGADQTLLEATAKSSVEMVLILGLLLAMTGIKSLEMDAINSAE